MLKQKSGKFSILILLDYLFLLGTDGFNLYLREIFNPYFTGLPILIHLEFNQYYKAVEISILILLDYLFLLLVGIYNDERKQTISILILLDYLFLLLQQLKNTVANIEYFNPYFTGLPILIPHEDSTFVDIIHIISILILLDYLFLLN